LRNINDLKHFQGLKILKLSNNNIDDISALEELSALEILDLENNKITNINSLNKCRNLRKLYLANNNLRYQIATLKTLQNLNLSDLTIQNNPFLSELLGYRHLLIYKLKSLKNLDGTEVTDIDIDIAAKFTVDNNQSVLASINVRPHTAKGVLGLRDFNKSSRLTIDEKEGGMNNTIISGDCVVRDKVISSIPYVKVSKVIIWKII
jgi:hypothetical protein